MPIQAEPATAPSRVAVFARAPVAGTVKTRLIPALGATGAAALHRTLVLRALEAAVDSGVGPVELWCAPDASDAFFRDCAARFGISLAVQGGGDLGERMRRAFDALQARSNRAVLIGSDIPAMTAEYLRAADAALAGGGEAVIGPAEDGGYVLIGLSRAAPELFRDIEWGAPGVAQETRARIARLGLRHVELPMLWDLDRPEDLSRPGVPSVRNMR
jgi:rSAM/selenodomain-associated transferase 1